MTEHKIVNVTVDLVSAPVKAGCADATRKVETVGFTIVKVTTDSGLVGFGITYHEVGGEATKVLIEKSIAPRLIGKDPFNTEEFWNDLFQYMRGVGRKGLTFCAISAVDIALWDLKGKILGVPLNKLFGSSSKERVQVYASGGWTSYDDDQLVQEAKDFVAEGYKMIKIKVGASGGIYHDLRRVKKVRDAVGENIEIMLDANNCWDCATAVRFANMVKEYNIMFLEEPVFADDIPGLRRFKMGTDMPLATGEHEYTRYGARDLLLAEAADIIQMDTARAGGFTEMLKIAGMTQAWNVKFAPHCMEYINLHLLSAVPNAMFAEKLFLFDDLWKNIIVNLPKTENGYIEVPKGPGLGMELNEDFIKDNREVI